MPTATTGGLLEWHNAGPLTTTWSAPAACSTEGATRSGLADLAFPWFMLLRVDSCEVQQISEQCRPNGDKLEELYADAELGVMETTAHYYSPGNQCPQDWATVGVIATNNGTVSASGLFQPTAFYQGAPGETTTFPPADFWANMLTSILEPTETAIACCPSGYSVDPWHGCYSNFPASELAGETACRFQYIGDLNDSMTTTVFKYFDTTTTMTGRGLPFPTGWRDSDDAVTKTVPLDSSGLPAATGDTFIGYGRNQTVSAVAQISPIYLVNSGGDDGESAAQVLRPITWATVGAMLAAWGVTMVAGVGLLAA